MRRRVRQAMTFLELAVAIVLAAALSTMVLQAVAWSMMARRQMDQRQAALVAADNALERLTAKSWLELAPHGPKDESPAEADVQSLPDGRLTTEIRPVASEPDARQLIVEVHWTNQIGGEDAPIHLTTFVWRR